ncbi:hypothetical protein U91I_03398 [alpha proteobacterium U9-1i]|nr:hypothetical protein U91I_03398 [alpha proteobacterium U9-1i]
MSASVRKLDLANAVERLRANAALAGPERRRFRRMPLVIGGRMLDPLGREHDCRTTDISPGDVRLAAPILPGVGDRIVIYLEGLGRMSGAVARRCGEGEVAVIFDFSAHKREKLAEQLTFAVNKDQLGLSDAPRIIGEGVQRARIEVEGLPAFEGEVLDFSLTGMTLKSPRTPPLIGSWVRVGGIFGRVARVIDGGFAVDFEARGPTAA